MISIASVILLYLVISFYFINHLFYNTVINGVNVSLKNNADADEMIKKFIKGYELMIIERDGSTEVITGPDIGLQKNREAKITGIYHLQNSLRWIQALFKHQRHYVSNLYDYNSQSLKSRINQLKCIGRVMTEPRNVSFRYYNGAYIVKEEVYGNKIIPDKINEAIKSSIQNGNTKLELNKMNCYENPKYRMTSEKTGKTRDILNKYVSSRIIYQVGDKKEVVDGKIISKWLRVDENLDVVISDTAVLLYVKGLSNRYDTVGGTRKFKTSTGKTVEVQGGLYGWKIDQSSEIKVLIENIKTGETIEREPFYSQRALFRGENEIGNSYVEINITKQHVWYYKDGKLIIQGSVVTGNPNRGFATVLGTYMLNYKEKNATLTGPGYEAKVIYWMPFFGNMGLHDASWRNRFGGEIYKTRGTHGCVNAPLHLAKTVYEHIEEGTPFIVYEE